MDYEYEKKDREAIDRYNSRRKKAFDDFAEKVFETSKQHEDRLAKIDREYSVYMFFMGLLAFFMLSMAIANVVHQIVKSKTEGANLGEDKTVSH